MTGDHTHAQRMGTWCIMACVLVACISLDANGRRRRESGEEPVEAAGAVSSTQDGGAQERSEGAQTTFLDSVNRGREVSLSSADLQHRPVSERPAAAEQPREPKPDSAEPDSNEKGVPAHDKAHNELETKTRTTVAAAPGYRIQCVAATQADALQQARTALKSKVPYRVDVFHAPPYYKLLVGLFKTRAEAERALYDVRGAGYPDAWIVPWPPAR